jgi:hypothetical protein
MRPGPPLDRRSLPADFNVCGSREDAIDRDLRRQLCWVLPGYLPVKTTEESGVALADRRRRRRRRDTWLLTAYPSRNPTSNAAAATTIWTGSINASCPFVGRGKAAHATHSLTSRTPFLLPAGAANRHDQDRTQHHACRRHAHHGDRRRACFRSGGHASFGSRWCSDLVHHRNRRIERSRI